MLLNAIKSGFYSEYMNVVEWTFKVFVKLASDYHDTECLEHHIKWFLLLPSSNNQNLGGGMEASLYGLSRNASLVESMSLLLSITFKDNFPRMLLELRTNHIKSLSQYFAFINEILPNMHKTNKN